MSTVVNRWATGINSRHPRLNRLEFLYRTRGGVKKVNSLRQNPPPPSSLFQRCYIIHRANHRPHNRRFHGSPPLNFPAYCHTADIYQVLFAHNCHRSGRNNRLPLIPSVFIFVFLLLAPNYTNKKICQYQYSLRPSKARDNVAASAYSKSPPTGKPRANLVILTGSLASCWRIYMAVASPSREGLVAKIISYIFTFPSRTLWISWLILISSGPIPWTGEITPPRT